MMIAIIAPVDNCTPPFEDPDAPASLSAPLLPSELAASPAAGSFGAKGSEVARAEKNEVTELEDMAGVSDIEVVVMGIGVYAIDDWEEAVLVLDNDAEVEVDVEGNVNVTKELDTCACTNLTSQHKMKITMKKH